MPLAPSHLGAAALGAALLTGCAASGPRPSPEAGAPLDMDDLFAWCIIPYDSENRTPEERVAMLQRLGFASYAVDWRAEHLPQTAREMALARDAGLRIEAAWLWLDARTDSVGGLSAANERVIAAVDSAGVETDFWVGFNENVFDGLSDEAAVARAVEIVGSLAERAAAVGGRVALYNHGGWTGRPENQVRVIEALAPDHEVGIVYNFHHGHEHLGRFDRLVDVMLPHLWAVNLNGMRPEGPKILTYGEGTHERAMLARLLEAGYDGPFGVIGHTEGEDVEVVLRRNLRGLLGSGAAGPEAGGPGTG